MYVKTTMKRSLLLLWLSHLFLDFFTGIWPIYKTISQIDITIAGLIAGLSGFIGEGFQLFFGYFSDRGYRKKCMILGLCLASSILWITFVAKVLACFFLLLLLMIGSACFHPAAAGFTGLLTPENKGRTILCFASGGAIGLAISQLTFTKLLSSYQGHALILLIPVALLSLLLSRYSFVDSVTSTTFSFKEFLVPFMQKRRTLLLLYFTQVANFTLWTAFVFLLPDLMRAKECHSWLCMGGGHLSFILCAALTMIPAGYLCDRYGHRRVLLCTLFFAICLFYGFLVHSSLSFFSTTLLLTLLGGSLGIINPILVSWGNKLVPESPSTVSALMMGCAWCLGNLGATWAGFIAQGVNNNPILITLSAMGLLIPLCFLFVLFVPHGVFTQPNRRNDDG
jgi:FSR family fosmidomycin resistance protein-like MFS transporter